MTVGAGVRLEDTMDSLLEDRLNREQPGVPQRRYEILNFSVGQYGILQNVDVLERKVFPFAPNAIVVGIFSIEIGRMTTYLAQLVENNIDIPYPEVRNTLQAAGVTSSMSRSELRRRIGPLSRELVRWSYERVRDIARQHGVPVVGAVLPEPVPGAGRDIDAVATLASEAGLPFMDLRGIYDGRDASAFRLGNRARAADARADPHWNEAGHALVAERVYKLLQERDVLGLGFAARAEHR